MSSYTRCSSSKKNKLLRDTQIHSAFVTADDVERKTTSLEFLYIYRLLLTIKLS